MEVKRDLLRCQLSLAVHLVKSLFHLLLHESQLRQSVVQLSTLASHPLHLAL